MPDQIGLFGSDDAEPEERPGHGARGVGPAKVADGLHALGASLPGEIHLGTSSWSFPGWAGIVYDKPAPESALSKKGLAAYSHHPLLRTVSIDRGFYQPLTLSEYSAYARQVPAHFRFMVKAPAFITRTKCAATTRARGSKSIRASWTRRPPLKNLLKPAIAGLAEKAGPLIFQFSPLSRRTLADVPAFAARLHAFLWAINQMCAGFSVAPLLAVEVRDGELLTREFATALKDAGARYCLGVHARMPAAADQLPLLRALWPGGLVVRWNLHAGFRYADAKAQYAPFNRLVDEDPETRATLARVIAATALAGYPVYLSANNKAEGSAPLTLIKLAEAVVGELRARSA